MYIGVVDWFTKKRGENVDMNKVKENIISEIVEKSKNTKNFKQFADAVWDVLKENEDLKKICADSRLPTCSLFHHLKNTAAVAVCMATDKGYDKETIQKIRVASLLHDVGKLEAWHLHGEKGIVAEHIKATERIVGEILSKCMFKWMENDVPYLPRLASRHHTGKWAEEYLPEHEIEKIIAESDSIASATDSGYSGGYYSGYSVADLIR